MPVLQSPPYQDKAGTQRWSEWFRIINRVLQNISISIDGIDDVVITSPGDNEVLQYDSGTGVWENQTFVEADIAAASRNLIAGIGLAGGGDLTADRTFNLDIPELTNETAVAGDDTVALYDTSAAAHREMAVQDLLKANPTAITTSVTAATHTHVATNRYLLCDTTSNAITVDLLAAATAGDGYRLDIKIVVATNAVTIDGSGAETIDGLTTIDLTTLHDNVSLLCDGSNWHII